MNNKKEKKNIKGYNKNRQKAPGFMEVVVKILKNRRAYTDVRGMKEVMIPFVYSIHSEAQWFIWNVALIFEYKLC